MFNEIITQLEKSGSLHDLIDAIVVARLRETYTVYREEHDDLADIDRLTTSQQADLAELSDDLHALERVISWYEVS